MQPQVMAATIAFVGVAFGAGMSMLNTYLGWRRERDKFARDRIWDTRRETYAEFVAALAKMERLSSSVLSGYGENARDGAPFHGGPRHLELMDAIEKAYADYVQLINSRQLIMTGRMDDRVFKVMSDAEDLGRADLEPGEWATRQQALYSNAERDVLAIGKADLGMGERASRGTALRKRVRRSAD